MVTVTRKPKARPLGGRFAVYCDVFVGVGSSIADAYGRWHYSRYGYHPRSTT